MELIIKNVDGDEHCRSCCSHLAWVFVGWSKDGTDEMAPCPYCEAGKRVEFSKWSRRQWPGGYWQGRSPLGVEATCDCQAKQLPRREALAKVRQLAAGIGRGM